MNRFFGLAIQRQGIQCQHQPSDGVFSQLRSAAVGAFALGFHKQAVLGGGEAELGGVQRRQPLGQFFGAGKLCAGGSGNHVGGRAAVEGNQPQIANLIHFPGVGHIDNALFAVDHRVLAVRGEAHHRNFSVVGKVVLHIGRATLLIAAPEHPNPSADGQPGIPQSRQGKQRGNGGAFVIHGAPAENPAVPNLAAPGIKAPVIPGGHYIQVAQHRDHFLAGSVLAPAQLTVHIHRGEAQLLRRRQDVVKAPSNLAAVGRSRLRLSLNAGNPQILLKTLKQGRL